MDPECKVLIVEDEAETLQCLRVCLEREGIPTASCLSRREALELFRPGVHKVLLADLYLGDGTALDLLADLRSRDPDLVVVVITGRPDQSSTAEALRMGVFDYLHKPLRGLRKIAETVNRAIQERENRDGRRETIHRKDHELEDTQFMILTQHERIMTIVDQVDVGLVVTDPDMVISLVNPRAEAHLGISGRDALGCPLADLPVGRSILASLVAAHEACLGGSSCEGDLRIRDPQGEPRVLNARSAPVRDRSGRVIGILSNLRDVTDERRTEDLRNRFLSVLSHELRTPITGIQSYVSVLLNERTGFLTEQQELLIREVGDQTRVLESQVDRLLCLARIEREEFRPSLETLPVTPLLEDAMRPLLRQALERGVRLVVSGGALKGWVRADRSDARRLLRALVENALQFSSSGGEVRISADAEGGKVRFVVEDDGIGIHPDHHGKIFDKFWQVEDPLRRSHGGCGLGLSLAQRIAQAHGSVLDVKSSPGKGAVFSFSLDEGCESETLNEGAVREGAGGVHVEEACSHRG